MGHLEGKLGKRLNPSKRLGHCGVRIKVSMSKELRSEAGRAKRACEMSQLTSKELQTFQEPLSSCRVGLTTLLLGSDVEADHSSTRETALRLGAEALLDDPLPRLGAQMLPSQLPLPPLALALRRPLESRVTHIANESCRHADLLQPSSYAKTVETVLAGANGEGLDGANEEPAVKGRGDVSVGVLEEAESGEKGGHGGDNDAAEDVRVPAEVLGGAVNDD